MKTTLEKFAAEVAHEIRLHAGGALPPVVVTKCHKCARLATALVELLRATDRELVAHGHDGLDIEASAHQIIDEALRPPLRVVE